MTRLIVPGSTDQSVTIHLSTATGGNSTGKVAADITGSYRRGPIGPVLGYSLSDLSSVTDAHVNGGFKEVANGSYRLDLYDAFLLDDGIDYVEVYLAGAGIVQTNGAYVIDLWQAGKINKQPRQNDPAGMAFQLTMANRLGTSHKATAPANIRAGSIGNIAVSLDMGLIFGDTKVTAVGTPTVTPSGALTCTALGPRDNKAMVNLAGTSVASTTYVISVPVTMQTGEVVNADFDAVTYSD